MENISTSLRRLHMSGMAMCWKTMTETHQADKLTFRDGLEILIQSEMDTRHHNKIARLIKNAGFRQGASFDYITLNVPPVALSIVPLQKMSLSVRQSYDYF